MKPFSIHYLLKRLGKHAGRKTANRKTPGACSRCFRKDEKSMLILKMLSGAVAIEQPWRGEVERMPFRQLPRLFARQVDPDISAFFRTAPDGL